MQLPSIVYRNLFILLAVIYGIGLFVPLMDNDAAHHANIGLNMYLTGDYICLIDAGKPYLDKPHFLFWTAAASYHVFGITSFAYRFPSFLFTILGVWSTYCLGKSLYNREIGKLAALMTASCFAIILANNDVRMEAILVGAGMMATWQGVAWIAGRKTINSFLLALALAIGFNTKGWSGIIPPVTALIAYVTFTKQWWRVWHSQVILVLLFFGLFISPVLYCFYIQFDLHPELVIRDQTGRSGVGFILWEQNFERFQGGAFGGSGKNNTFLFFHSFLWAFAPWTLLAILSIGKGVKRKAEPGWWLSVVPIAIMALLITFSGYRLPHYLNVILPYSALLSAAYVSGTTEMPKALRITQMVICIMALLVMFVISIWAFPIQNVWVGIGLLALLAAGSLLVLRSRTNRWITYSAISTVIVFYLLNANFYPQLLSYQGGITLAKISAGKVDPQTVYYWPSANSASFSFYAKTLRQNFTDSIMLQPSPVWVLTETRVKNELDAKGLQQIDLFVADDYSTDKLKGRFINPATRATALDSLFLIRVK